MGTNKMENVKIKLSTLWIVVLFNYLYADVIGFFAPGMIEGIISGDLGVIKITQGFLFGTAILMEIPILMIFLSRTLNYEANRWTNIVTGVIYTIVIFVTLLLQQPQAYYLFFGIVEVVITSLIAWYAWKWQNQES